MQMYLAVDIGGTKTLIASFDEAGTIVDRLKFETNPDYDAFITDLKQRIRDSGDLSDVAAIGVAAPGHIEDDNGIVEGFGNLGWSHKDLSGDLADLGVPIVLDNDANLGALGEAIVGAGASKRKVLYITIS